MENRQEAGKLAVAFVLAVLRVRQGDAPSLARINLWNPRWDRRKENGMLTSGEA